MEVTEHPEPNEKEMKVVENIVPNKNETVMEKPIEEDKKALDQLPSIA